jgi:hypothetical protein
MDGYQCCPGCALALPANPTTGTHRYFNASPECWAVFNEVLAAEYSDTLRFAATHQLTVDAYAAQHAGGAHPDKSVAIHLAGLGLVLETGLRPTEVPPRLQHLATVTDVWPRLEPPSDPWTLTVLDVALADDPTTTVRAWATEVWGAWHGCYAAIRPLVTAASTSR